MPVSDSWVLGFKVCAISTFLLNYLFPKLVKVKSFTCLNTITFRFRKYVHISNFCQIIFSFLRWFEGVYKANSVAFNIYLQIYSDADNFILSMVDICLLHFCFYPIFWIVFCISKNSLLSFFLSCFI